ncbi:MAG: TrmH family RNA methyltransferase, partial [Rhodothermales bacterium]
VSAVMRTAEALGFQAFHVITHEEQEDGVRYKSSERVTQGAEKWLDVWQWPTPEACVSRLKTQGYRVVATHLDARARPIDEIDFTQKTALVFGNERDGISPELLALADASCIVPMAGFTQSFNISVAAALCLYHARRDRLARRGCHGDLTEAQREALRALFYLKSVRQARAIMARALEEDRGR